ncbi:transglutaminase-like domain-containing protein [Enterococcus rivorum]|uniref:Transglutaminase-like domain-containing protein n=2 Tax=Enterococcus rivorum TaxID=762845 RepID=A0A1E5KXK5_9ENTE|nr:transglutaminase-like domain-containing protein [Enterococcus rivorum]MBP2097237.1 hypothetical protein [Enterococcus rivorum]OEH82409.1 hypothetical protein BCR26_02965 [Enterococcus rivorum]
MKHRVQQKGIYAFLTFLIIAVASQPFLIVYKLQPFYFFAAMIAVLCLITVLVKNQLLRVPLYIFAYLFTLHYYFPFKKSFSWSWFMLFLENLLRSYQQLRNGELGYFSDILALSLILLLLIFMIVLLIEYERWLFNSLLIVSYLLLLVIVNHIHLGGHIMIITGAFLLYYQAKKAPQTVPLQKKRKVMLLTIATIVFASVTAYYFPQVFPKPKNFLLAQTSSIRESLNKQGFYQKVNGYGLLNKSKTGFSEKDEQLGGPLMDDPTVLFTALQTNRHYWHVETKDRYTGKGWRSLSDKETIFDPQESAILIDPNYQGTFLEESIIDLSFKDQSNYLPQPYGKLVVPLDNNKKTSLIPQKNRVNFEQRPINLSLIYQAPVYTETELKQTQTNHLEEQENKQNTQIPMTMPTRINELATKLTKQEKNQYDKVKAIETYLRTTGGYRYSKIDTPYTPEDKDYVDYFLFESKIGYCDNYSSAMVILLRTLDIPSRWVKGFAPGERSYDSAAATNKYTIRNSDAHSWPEVYFEGYGWIPFEPTPSFTNPIPSGKETNKEIDSTSKDSSDTSDTSTQSSLKQSTTPSSSNKEIKSKNEPLTKLLPIFKTIGISLLVLLLTTLAFYLKRYFFLLYFKLYRLVFPKKFTESYIILLNKAEKLFYRWENEPLNQYAIRFEKEY